MEPAFKPQSSVVNPLTPRPHDRLSFVDTLMLNIFRGIHSGPLPPLSPQQADLAQRLRQHVEMLAGVIGERNVITHPHNLEVAAGYVERVLNDAAYITQSQHYTAAGRFKARNIDASLPGTGQAREIVLVGAHYDSIHLPGGGC